MASIVNLGTVGVPNVKYGVLQHVYMALVVYLQRFSTFIIAMYVYSICYAACGMAIYFIVWAERTHVVHMWLR